MGFSIWVADDPELEDDAPESGFPHFSTNNSAMAALREEMRAQGMLDATLEWKLSWNQGEHVGPAEISGALALARPEPETMHMEGDREFWQQWLHFLEQAVKHGGIVVW